MNEGLEQEPINEHEGSTAGTLTKANMVKIYVLAAVEFWIATDAVVAAMHLVASKMSNWFVAPLVLAAFLLAASATYAIAYHRLTSVFQMTKGQLPTAGTAGSER